MTEKIAKRFMELYDAIKKLEDENEKLIPLVKEKISNLEKNISLVFTQIEGEMDEKCYGLAKQKLTTTYPDILDQIEYWGKGNIDVSKYEERAKELSQQINQRVRKNA
jgi:hypothetical protein